MANPPSPLAATLLAIRQVRCDLVEVERLLHSGRFSDASDVVATARAQLAQVSWTLVTVAGAERAVEEAASRLRHPSSPRPERGLR